MKNNAYSIDNHKSLNETQDKIISIDKIKLKMNKMQLNDILLFGARMAVLYSYFLFCFELEILECNFIVHGFTYVTYFIYYLFAILFAVFLWMFAMQKSDSKLLCIGRWISAVGFTSSVIAFNVSYLIGIFLYSFFAIGITIVSCSFFKHPQRKISIIAIVTAIFGAAMVIFPIIQMVTHAKVILFGGIVNLFTIKILWLIPFIILLLNLSGRPLIDPITITISSKTITLFSKEDLDDYFDDEDDEDEK